MARHADHVSLAEPRCRFHKGIENRLEIEGRAADDLEHVGGGGLLLQRFAQLVKQPRVLDGDDGLISKGLEQSNLPFGKEPHLGASQRDRANHGAFAHQRDRKHRAEAQAPCEFAAFGKFVRLSIHVSDVQGPLIENRSARHCPADQRERLDLSNRTIMGNGHDPVAVRTKNGRVVRLAQPCRALADRVEDGLNRGRRPCNSPEGFAGRRLLLQCLSEFAGFPVELFLQVGCRRADRARGCRLLGALDLRSLSAARFHRSATRRHANGVVGHASNPSDATTNGVLMEAFP